MMMVRQNRTEQGQIARPILYVGGSLLTTTVEEVVLQAVAVTMMEENTMAEGREKNAKTLTKNGRDKVIEEEDESDDKVHHIEEATSQEPWNEAS